MFVNYCVSRNIVLARSELRVVVRRDDDGI